MNNLIDAANTFFALGGWARIPLGARVQVSYSKGTGMDIFISGWYVAQTYYLSEGLMLLSPDNVMSSNDAEFAEDLYNGFVPIGVIPDRYKVILIEHIVTTPIKIISLPEMAPPLSQWIWKV